VWGSVDAITKQAHIRRLARENQVDPDGARILWSRHAITELFNEGWQRVDVELGLQRCDLIEDYPHLHRRLPDCLVLGWRDNGEPFHAVVAIDAAKDRLLIVTVYKPSDEEWDNDWRKRKQ
jgi:hypothetical protein